MTKSKLPLIALTLSAFATSPAAFAVDKVPAGTNEATTGAAASPSMAPDAKPEKTSFKGKITAVDKTAKSITVEGKEGTQVITIPDKTKLKKGEGSATWDDLKVGEEARGKFVKTADGKMEAASLRVGPKPEKKEKTADDAKE